MGLMIEWDWRIEGKRSILCGSGTDEQRWPRALAWLTNTTVAGVTLFGRLPEVDLTLSNGMHIVSLMTAQGDPAWTLFDRRNSGGCNIGWTNVQRGCIRHVAL